MEKIILLLALFTMNNKESSKGLVGITEYINNLQIDPGYTEDKIKLARKIAPLMPVDYIEPINRSIYLTESIVRIMELNDFMTSKSSVIQTAHIPIEDNRERLSKIVSVIQEEVPRSNMKNIGTVLELIANMDKYKKMFELLNVVMKNQNLGKDSNNLAKMVEPMMKSKGSAEGEGSLDIEKIMNIMSLLNKTKEKSPSPENKDHSYETKTMEERPLEGEIRVQHNLEAQSKDKDDPDIKIVEKKET